MFTEEELEQIEKELSEKIDKYGIDYSDYSFDIDDFECNENENYINITYTVNGDWKWDHRAIRELVNEYCDEHNLFINYCEEDITVESDSDDYESKHEWVIKKI